MTTKKDQTFCKKLLNVVKRIYDSKSQKAFRKKMSLYLDYFRNKYWEVDDENSPAQLGGIKDGQDSEISVNLLFSTVSTIAPLLTDNRPIWHAKAREPWGQILADRLKNILDILWVDLDMDETVLKCCMDSLIMRFGLFKVWFDPVGRDGDGEITIETVDPRTFVMAPGYTDIWEAPWCGTITSRPLSWIWKRFPEKKKDVTPDKIMEDDLDNDGNFKEKDDIEVCDRNATVYEIWMQDDEIVIEILKDQEKGTEEKVPKPKYPNGRYLVFTEGTKGKVVILDDRPYPYHHGKPPFVPLYDYIDPHNFEGICEADQLEGLILEANYLFRKVSRHVREWSSPNHAAEEGCGITPEAWKKDAPGGNRLFLLKPGKQPPMPIATPQLDRMALDFFSSLFGLIEEVSGVSEISKGRVTKKERQSASEIQTLVETSHTRTRQRVRNLEWSLKRVLKLSLELMMQYYIEDKPRTYSKRSDDGFEWYDVSASKEFVRSMIREYYDKSIAIAGENNHAAAERLKKES